jgi:hypothetical protein
MSIATWTGVPLVGTTAWSLLTPNLNALLTTITQLGGYTINQIGGLTLNQGYTPAAGTTWVAV